MTTVEMHRAKMTQIVKALREQGRLVVLVDSAITKTKKIDFVLDGTAIKFKTCKYNQVNIIFELLNGRNAGWFKDTEAKGLLYYIQEPNIIYYIDIDKTRLYTQTNEVKKTSKGMNGGGLCWMIPIKDLKMNGLVKEVIYP